jgi:serine/threonine protein kinase
VKGAQDTRKKPPTDESASPEPSKVTGPRVRDSSVDLDPGTEVGRFTIERELGRGGMGVVFLARDRELDRKVALKLLRTDRDEQPAARAQRRMLREARAMAAVSHPNLVTIYECGVYLDHVFLAMEFVDGQSLDDWVEAESRTLEEVVGVYEQAGVALERLHGAGIVHRDFKPDNVVVDGEGNAKLLDLGIARRVALTDEVKNSAVELADAKRTGVDVGALSESLSEGAMIGTPAYMAPEQMLGGEVGPAADQFAFALSFYESLCGRRPFAGETELEVISNTIAGVVRPWNDDEHVPEKLRPVIERMLSGRREDRYPSMTEALTAIRASLGVRRRLRVLTDRWLRNDRKDEHLLPKGELLKEAIDLAKRRPDSLDEDQKALIALSREAVRRRLLTRRALIGSVGALAVGMVPALYLLRQRTKQLEAETRARVENTLDTVVAQIDGVFAESTETLRLMLDQRPVWMPDVLRLLADGAVGDPAFTDELADATRALNRFFRPVLEHSPTISSLMVCTETFEYLAFDDIGARRLAEPYRLYNRVVNTAAFGDAAFQLFDGEQPGWLERGAASRRGEPWPGYDPGERIFHRRAAHSPAIGWTEPYLFFVTKEAGMTGSTRFVYEGAPFVLAVDVTLTDLSQITSGVDTPGVTAIVLTRGDEVVALPRDEELRSRENIVSVFAGHGAERRGDEAAVLPRLGDLGYDQLSAAWAQVRGEGTGVHDCLVGETPLCVGVRAIGREEQDLTLVVVAERR